MKTKNDLTPLTSPARTDQVKASPGHYPQMYWPTRCAQLPSKNGGINPKRKENEYRVWLDWMEFFSIVEPLI